MGIVPNAQTKSLNTFFIGVTLKQVLTVQFTAESTLNMSTCIFMDFC